MSSPRQAYCLFCEDIRAEQGNKQSYMGVYSGEMTAMMPLGTSHETPFGLPKLVIAFWLMTEIDDIPDRVTVTLYAPPGRSEIFKHEMDVKATAPPHFPEWATKFTLHGQIPFQNFLLAEDGIIELTLDTQREILVAGRLRLRLQHTEAGAPIEVPTASLPPPEQSLPVALETKRARARRPPSNRRTARTPEQG
jgi:hypothetical protein